MRLVKALLKSCIRSATVLPPFFSFFTTIPSEEELGLLHSNDDVRDDFRAFNVAVDHKNLALGYDLR